MKKRNKIVSFAMIFIFAVAFLMPSFNMPSKAAVISAPLVSALAASSVDDESATLNARLTSNGSYDVTEYGFYYAEEDSYITSSDEKVFVGSDDLDLYDQFHANIDGLDSDTNFYYKAYIKYKDNNDVERIVWSSTKMFTTDGNDVEIATYSATDVGEDYATLNGEITSDSDIDIDEYGFFYGTEKYDVADGEDGSSDWDEAEGDEDDFYLELEDLDTDEIYYYMAYAIDEDGNYYYGSVRSFATDDEGKPEVTTDTVTDLQSRSATLNGTIESFGDDSEITEYGFYYGTSSSPSTKKIVGDDYDNIDEGDDFDYDLSDLKSNTKYYFRAYAKNDEGTAYGSIKSFTTKKAAAANLSIFTIGSKSYYLNGSYRTMDAAPYSKNNRTYMPIRYAAYAMGLTDANIVWNEATQAVILSKGNTYVILLIGSRTMYVNGVPRVMDVVPEITNNRTCLPIAWVASAFGCTATWNSKTNTVTVRNI